MNNGNAKIEKSIQGIGITIPSKKNWLALIFGTVWMGGWFFGFISVSGMLFTREAESTGLSGFMGFWLLAWTIGGLAIIAVLLWGYFGRESLIIDSNEIRLEKTVFGIGQKKRFEKSAVKNFRIETGNGNWMGANRWAFWGLGPGKILFDYGFKTYSFGLGVDDAEARYIVQLLNDYIEK